MLIESNYNYNPCENYTKTVRPCNNSRMVVRVAFSEVSKEVSAEIEIEGKRVKVKKEDLPKEFRKIHTLTHFGNYFAATFMTVTQSVNGGDYFLSVSQRGLGGMPPRVDPAQVPRAILERLNRDLPGLMDAQMRAIYGRDDAERGFTELRDGLQGFLQTIGQGTLLQSLERLNNSIPLPQDMMHLIMQEPPLPWPEMGAIRNWMDNMRNQIGIRIDGMNGMLRNQVIQVVDGRVILQGVFTKVSRLALDLLAGRFRGIREFNIYGLHSVTFDGHLIQQPLAGARVTVIAPMWIIPDSRSIELGGANCTDRFDGPAVNFPQFVCLQGGRGMVDNQGSRNAAVGSPGFPGGSGGRFWGLGENFVGGLQRLRPLSPGGTGGAGQDGGTGIDGSNGSNAVQEWRPRHRGGRWDQVLQPDANQNQLHTNREIPGGVGGRGGNPGAGGLGGYGGSAQIDTPQRPNIYSVHFPSGGNGPDGRPGPGGRGGLNGRQWSGTYDRGREHWNGHLLPQFTTPEGRRAANGSPGNVNAPNALNRPTPEVIPPIDRAARFAEFRAFSRGANTMWTLAASQAFIRRVDNGHIL